MARNPAKVLGQDYCQEEQDQLGRRTRSCQEAEILPCISWVRSWPRSWPELGRHNPAWHPWASLGQVGKDLEQESCPRTFCWELPRYNSFSLIPSQGFKVKLLDRDMRCFYVIFCTNYAYRDRIASLRRSGLGLLGPEKKN